MKLTHTSVLEIVAISVMAGVVLTLGVLQYRWTGEISRVEQERLKTALATSVRGFTQELAYDFRQLCESLEIDPEAPSSSVEVRVSRQYLAWNRSISGPNLVSDLHIWKRSGSNEFLEVFDTASGRFQQVKWPAQLASVHEFLQQQTAQLSRPVNDREALYYPWIFFDDARDSSTAYNTMALIRPVFEVSPSADVQKHVLLAGFLVVQLDAENIEEQYLPGLVERHFGTTGLRSFEVAVRSAKPPYQAIYLSDVNFPLATSAPDAAVNLFDSVADEARRRGHPPLQASAAPRQWQLVVQHPAGSLGMAVAKWRQRSLGMGLGLLAVLAASMVLIFIVARRAERLAKLQLEFVAGVSHELCTPLSVINSAAENLADGVIDTSQQVREYGTMIRDQGRRLESLVDEVLLFAAGRFGRTGYELRPVAIGNVIAQTLAASEPMLQEAGFAVEQEIPADLPPVLADVAAVSKCMENLLSNAVKYTAGERWLAVRTRCVACGTGAEVQISVEDKGIGVPPDDLGNIFEPFYRGQVVRDRQIRGVGLGLYLVKRTMEGMGGSVTVSSEIGHGTSFTLHFPVCKRGEQPQAETAEA
jgi:two-component system sensor histidine kinase SenX3